MTHLRKRMIEDLQLRGMSKRTIEMYTRSVRQLSQHYHKSPDRITEEELRQYFLYNKNERKWSRTAATIALCGIKFFYTYTLKKDWTTFELVRPAPQQKLPDILTVKEVNKILKLVRMQRHRVCLSVIYSCGLRLQEGTHLQISDIDSERMLIHVHNGKGAKDRFVPLPDRTLALLREQWLNHRNPTWLFPAPGRGGVHEPTANKPLPKSSVQIAFKEAVGKTRIRKHVSVHTLRHSYATQLMEKGVDLRIIQEYLGHSNPRTTAVYAHLTKRSEAKATKAINRLMVDL